MSTAMQEQVEPIAEDIPPLRATDRCDVGKCGAQALVRWTNDNPKSPAYGRDVDACGHHSKKYGPTLLSQGFGITQDISDTINTKPSPSANV